MTEIGGPLSLKLSHIRSAAQLEPTRAFTKEGNGELLDKSNVTLQMAVIQAWSGLCRTAASGSCCVRANFKLLASAISAILYFLKGQGLLESAIAPRRDQKKYKTLQNWPLRIQDRRHKPLHIWRASFQLRCKLFPHYVCQLSLFVLAQPNLPPLGPVLL